MNNQSTSLSFQVQVESFKRYLEQNPQEAQHFALTYFKHCLKLLSKCQKLENQPQLFPLPKTQEKLDLLLTLGELHLEIKRLKKDKQDLLQLLDVLTTENAPLPDFLGDEIEI